MRASLAVLLVVAAMSSAGAEPARNTAGGKPVPAAASITEPEFHLLEHLLKKACRSYLQQNSTDYWMLSVRLEAGEKELAVLMEDADELCMTLHLNYYGLQLPQTSTPPLP